jgi:DNA mismatch repair protein MutS
LINFQENLFEAESKLASREYDIFSKVREEILDSFDEIKNLSDKVSFIDFIQSLAKVSYNNNYSKPKINLEDKLNISEGRHIVIEQIEKDFISNDLNLSNKDFIHIIT